MNDQQRSQKLEQMLQTQIGQLVFQNTILRLENDELKAETAELRTELARLNGHEAPAPALHAVQ